MQNIFKVQYLVNRWIDCFTWGEVFIVPCGRNPWPRVIRGVSGTNSGFRAGWRTTGKV